MSIARTSLFAALVFCPAIVAAETVTDFCVTSGSEFKSALDQIEAAVDAGTATGRYRILLAQGEHFPPALTDAGSVVRPFPSLEILGGYEGVACQTRTVDATNTRLTLATPPVGGLGRLSLVSGGDVVVEGVTFGELPGGQQVPLLRVKQAPGLRRRALYSVGLSVFKGKNAAADAAPAHEALEFVVGATATPPVSVRLESTIVKGFGGTDCAVTYREVKPPIPLPGHEVIVANSTIAFNDGCGLGVNQMDDDTRLVVQNTIFSQNTGAGIATSGDSDARIELHHNMMSILNFLHAAPALSRGGSILNPQLTSFDAPVPGFGSPAINSGTTYLDGGITALDSDGGPRWRGSRPDRGAVETLFEDRTTFTVTTAADGGPGSLRQALIDAQNPIANPGPDRIVFDIKDANANPVCPAVINLATPLPAVRDILIDGWTQPSSTENTLIVGNNANPCIHLSGSGTLSSAFVTPAGDLPFLAIRGLAFGGFVDRALLDGWKESVLTGNHFGLGLPNDAFVVAENNSALEGAGAEYLSVGGRSPGDRNVFAGSLSALVAEGALQLLGNQFGANYSATGLALAGTSTDHVLFRMTDASFTVAGNLFITTVDVRRPDSATRLPSASIRRNVVGLGGACLVDPQAACVSAAVAADGHFSVENLPDMSGAIDGLQFEENVFGTPLTVSTANSFGIQPRSVSLSRNLFRGITGGLAIAAADGVANAGADNDVDTARQADSNLGQNYPTLVAGTGSANSGAVAGTLSTREGDYVIEIFAGDGCPDVVNGDEHRLVGIGTVHVPDNGSQNGTGAFQIPVSASSNLAGKILTATATDARGNSSMLSPSCKAYVVTQSDAIFSDGFEDP